jgi:hypothetical protein
MKVFHCFHDVKVELELLPTLLLYLLFVRIDIITSYKFIFSVHQNELSLEAAELSFKANCSSIEF